MYCTLFEVIFVCANNNIQYFHFAMSKNTNIFCLVYSLSIFLLYDYLYLTKSRISARSEK